MSESLCFVCLVDRTGPSLGVGYPRFCSRLVPRMICSDLDTGTHDVKCGRFR